MRHEVIEAGCEAHLRHVRLWGASEASEAWRHWGWLLGASEACEAVRRVWGMWGWLWGASEAFEAWRYRGWLWGASEACEAVTNICACFCFYMIRWMKWAAYFISLFLLVISLNCYQFVTQAKINFFKIYGKWFKTVFVNECCIILQILFILIKLFDY